MERENGIEFTERCQAAALVVLDRFEHELGSEVDKLCDNDPKTLLRWKGVHTSKMGLVSKKQAFYKKMVTTPPRGLMKKRTSSSI